MTSAELRMSARMKAMAPEKATLANMEAFCLEYGQATVGAQRLGCNKLDGLSQGDTAVNRQQHEEEHPAAHEPDAD